MKICLWNETPPKMPQKCRSSPAEMPVSVATGFGTSVGRGTHKSRVCSRRGLRLSWGKRAAEGRNPRYKEHFIAAEGNVIHH